MELDFEKLGGLIPAVITDVDGGRLLMVGFVNDQAWRRSLETGYVTLWSRSRRKLWTKGETSGHTLQIEEIRTDCDSDAIEFRVQPLGPGVCHEGFRSCFSWKWEEGSWLRADEKVFDPSEVYSL